MRPACLPCAITVDGRRSPASAPKPLPALLADDCAGAERLIQLGFGEYAIMADAARMRARPGRRTTERRKPIVGVMAAADFADNSVNPIKGRMTAVDPRDVAKFMRWRAGSAVGRRSAASYGAIGLGGPRWSR